MNNAEKIKLLPCPFCGAEPWLRSTSRGYSGAGYSIGAAITCTNCKIEMTGSAEFDVSPSMELSVASKNNGIKSMIDKWNTRQHIDDLVENINSFGGCDAQDEYSRGWDDAIDVAAQRVIDYFGGGENG